MNGDPFQWRALLFGFVNAMQVLHWIMVPVMTKLKMMGIGTINWVDDLILLVGDDLDVT